MEYSITGRSAVATPSRRISIASDSRASRIGPQSDTVPPAVTLRPAVSSRPRSGPRRGG